jgi:hypothetical protein
VRCVEVTGGDGDVVKTHGAKFRAYGPAP